MHSLFLYLDKQKPKICCVRLLEILSFQLQTRPSALGLIFSALILDVNSPQIAAHQQMFKVLLEVSV